MSGSGDASGPPLVQHTGGCHCGAVRYEVWAPAEITVYDCNCTICTKKQNKHFIVPHSKFTLIQGDDFLTAYRFGTKKANHHFCKICGVQSFYQPRSNQDGYGVMPHCLDPGTVKKMHIKCFDGENWEQAMQKDNSILQHSKEQK